MPLDTPNMINMMMETEPARASGGAGGQQAISAAITAQLGAPADLAHHAQQLGESLPTSHSMPSVVTSWIQTSPGSCELLINCTITAGHVLSHSLQVKTKDSLLLCRTLTSIGSLN